MSVPMQKAPRAAAATSTLAVPTKGSNTNAPGRACPRLAMTSAISASMLVGPRYLRFFSVMVLTILRSPSATTRPKKARRSAGFSPSASDAVAPERSRMSDLP